MTAGVDGSVDPEDAALDNRRERRPGVFGDGVPVPSLVDQGVRGEDNVGSMLGDAVDAQANRPVASRRQGVARQGARGGGTCQRRQGVFALHRVAITIFSLSSATVFFLSMRRLSHPALHRCTGYVTPIRRPQLIELAWSRRLRISYYSVLPTTLEQRR